MVIIKITILKKGPHQGEVRFLAPGDEFRLPDTANLSEAWRMPRDCAVAIVGLLRALNPARSYEVVSEEEVPA